MAVQENTNLLLTPDAANYLNITITLFEHWVHAGYITYQMRNGLRHFTTKELDRVQVELMDNIKKSVEDDS